MVCECLWRWYYHDLWKMIRLSRTYRWWGERHGQTKALLYLSLRIEMKQRLNPTPGSRVDHRDFFSPFQHVSHCHFQMKGMNIIGLYEKKNSIHLMNTLSWFKLLKKNPNDTFAVRGTASSCIDVSPLPWNNSRNLVLILFLLSPLSFSLQPAFFYSGFYSFCSSFFFPFVNLLTA